MKSVLTKSIIFVVFLFATVSGLSALSVDITSSEAINFNGARVYLGGIPVGVSIGTEGVIITGASYVITDRGVVKPLSADDVKPGDILMSINELPVRSSTDIAKIINGNNFKVASLKYIRNGEVLTKTVNLAKDVLTKEFKLGISVKDNITGIGTLTYITKDRRFGALGHHILDSQTGLSSDLNKGFIYSCKITGIKKAQDGVAGELKGSFSMIDGKIGGIDRNNICGIFGTYDELPTNAQLVEIASPNQIEIGKAFIYSTVSGEIPQYYEIEIVKVSIGKAAAIKNFVINIKDERLLSATGGIVQGMSGSPILQNGRLIGAVTHVFVNNPERGYGIYIENMLLAGAGDRENFEAA